MSESVSDNRRIAKNTVYLYFRMFLMMAIGLYTSRVVLNALGVSDYGLNNAVGGAVSLFTFLNGALAQGTQLYLNFSLGTGRIEKSKKVFSSAVINHVVFAIIVVLKSGWCRRIYISYNWNNVNSITNSTKESVSIQIGILESVRSVSSFFSDKEPSRDKSQRS